MPTLLKVLLAGFRYSTGAFTVVIFQTFISTQIKKPSEYQKSLHLASASDAEVPRLHHGEVGESAAHSVMRETVCAGEDVCTLHVNLELSSPTTCVYVCVVHSLR